MQDTEFHHLANATLNALADALEPAYAAAELDDIVQEDGVLTLITARGRTLVISRHSAMQQIWLASPISGGLHFSYDAAQQDFRLPDGRTLIGVLNENFRNLGMTLTL